MELAIDEAKPFTGEIEIDCLLFWTTTGAGPERTRSRQKTPVIGLPKRGGKVFTGVVKNCSKAELEPIFKGQVLSNTTIYTDGRLGYDGLALGGCKHRCIYHHDNEFARGKNLSTASEAFGVMPNFVSSRSVASGQCSSFSLSKNPSGTGIIGATTFIQFSAKTSEVRCAKILDHEIRKGLAQIRR